MPPSIKFNWLFNMYKTAATKILDTCIKKNVAQMIINNLEIIIFFLLMGYVNIKEIVLSLYSSINSLEINIPANTIKTILVLSTTKKKSSLVAPNVLLSIYIAKNNNPARAKHAAKAPKTYCLRFIFRHSKRINLSIPPASN